MPIRKPYRTQAGVKLEANVGEDVGHFTEYSGPRYDAPVQDSTDGDPEAIRQFNDFMERKSKK